MDENTVAPVPEPETSTAPGWFGKIPALGDFATRRLPHDFTDVWDAWLAESIEASQEALGSGWRATYLRAPIWRFALAPEVIDERFWFGVLMPSVDRVGRNFPLTIATAVVHPPRPPFAVLENWFERVAGAALGCLVPEATAEQLETALAAITPFDFVPFDAPLVIGEDSMTRVNTVQGVDVAFARAATILLLRELQGTTLWWARFESENAPTIVVSRGLPQPQAFARLLDGTL